VDDASYFYDGEGMVTGDTIRVGAVEATITLINYATNTLTLASAITWADNANVNLPYTGSAPDIGAFQT
jgi:hypothetical protein